jgi:N-methylhydantoinase A
VVLGHLDPRGELVGGLKLDADAARRAIAQVGDRLDLDAVTAAAGIVAIGAAAMANSVRAVTTERGLDPRDFALFAYGGNGPLHVSLVARELGIDRVVIPPNPALFSALGMLLADARADVVQTGVRALQRTDAAELEASFRSLELECEQQLKSSAVAVDAVRFVRAADMRYVGQEHTVTVQLAGADTAADPIGAVKAAFDAAHELRYSHSAHEEPAEIVTLRVTAVGEVGKPQLPELAPGRTAAPASALVGSRPVVFAAGEEPTETAVYRRTALLAGNRIIGPAVIEEATTTTLLRPGDSADVDHLGNLHCSIGARS